MQTYFDIEGHRGARGLCPENTLPAFARALTIGVTTLELDVGVTADQVVVVMHERALNPAVARDETGCWITAPGPDVHSLSLAELASFDVGRIDPKSQYANDFPLQQAVDRTKPPRLDEVFLLTKRAGNDTAQFNIETKISPEQPAQTLGPEPFADALLDVIREHGVEARVIIQSFDWRVLQHMQKVAPGIRTSYLTSQQPWLDNLGAGKPAVSIWTAGFDIDQHDGSVPAVIEAAGGAIWSPSYHELDETQLRDAHDRKLQVIVWTVNDESVMRSLIEKGVDGIISDYPDRLRRVVAAADLSLPKATPVVP